MGYTTDFEGALTLSKPLTSEQKVYINNLSDTRRMKRDVNKLMELYKGKHGYPGVPETADPSLIYGIDGEFYVNDDDERDPSIIDYNIAPGQDGFYGKTKAQPGLWCDWIISENNELEWNGGEKFYNYIEWLEYLIDRFFSKWGVLLNGEITWEGENSDDIGKIVVKNNVIKIKNGYKIYR